MTLKFDSALSYLEVTVKKNAKTIQFCQFTPWVHNSNECWQSNSKLCYLEESHIHKNKAIKQTKQPKNPTTQWPNKKQYNYVKTYLKSPTFCKGKCALCSWVNQ